MTGFSESVDGSGNVNYTWACDGSAMGGSCAASYTPGGSSCQPGGVGASVGSPLSIASTGLCAAGPSAVHDFTQTAPDNSGNVYYSWACGSSMAGGLCVSHYVAISGGSSCNPGFTVGNVRGSITANTP
ncbi:MAG TPA: hypothetical protein PK765_02565 [bacterium]|nr:hypothetical protein [bacterium]